VTYDCALGQPLRTGAETLADLYRQIRQVGLDFAAADTRYVDPLAPTQPLGGTTLTLPVVALLPVDLSQIPDDDSIDWGQRLLETSGIVADPMLPKAQWLMHNAAGWDWFLGFSYVSLSFLRDLDYLIASALFPVFGVGLQGVRTAGVWGSALRDDAGYDEAIMQTALLSLAAFGLYVAKLPPGSLRSGGSLMTPAGPLAYATSTVNTAALGRGLVIATELAHVLFARGNQNNHGYDQEQRVRDALTEEGYTQPYGVDDQEVAKNLGIKGKVADFVGYNDEIDSWLIAESKGGNIDHAIKQLENTNAGLTNTRGVGSTEFRIYTNADQYPKLQGPQGLAGYRVDSNGYLGWIDEFSSEWHYVEVDGVKVLVQMIP